MFYLHIGLDDLTLDDLKELAHGGLEALEWNRSHGLPEGTETLKINKYSHRNITTVEINEGCARLLAPLFNRKAEAKIYIDHSLLVPGEFNFYEDVHDATKRYVIPGKISIERDN